MPIYKDANQLYTCAQLLFDQIQQENPRAIQAVQKAKLTIRFQCSQPEAEIFINGRSRPAGYTFGPNAHKPDLDISLSSDTLHQIMLGELALPKALGNGSLRVKGPIFRTLVLAELFLHSQRIYPRILDEQGVSK